MKLKLRNKEDRGTSKAVKNQLALEGGEIGWSGDDSFSSVASSVTAPPSQTASFYKKVLGDDLDFSSDESDDLHGEDHDGSNHGSRNRRQSVSGHDDDDASWRDNQSQASNSADADKKMKKKKKKSRFKRAKKKIFGGGGSTTIPEQDDEDQDGDQLAASSTHTPPRARRGRRLSLFGNSSSQHESNQTHSSVENDVSGDQSSSHDNDDYYGAYHSQDATASYSDDGALEDLGYEDAAPTVGSRAQDQHYRSNRRGSIGGFFSRSSHHPSTKDRHHTDDGSRQQEGAESLGYEDAAPTVNHRSRHNQNRRGSLGGFFAKQKDSKDHHSDDGGSKYQEAMESLGYEDAAPSVGQRSQVQQQPRPHRRGSIGGFFARKDNNKDQQSEDASGEGRSQDTGPNAGRSKANRRGSLGGTFMQKKETSVNRRSSLSHSGSRHDVTGDNRRHHRPRGRRNSLLSTASEHIPASSQSGTHTKSRRRQSLTCTADKTEGAPKEIHWIINQERKARGMYLFERNAILDALAKGMATELAAGCPPTPTEFYGNVGVGESLLHIHQTIMEETKSVNRKNILSETFTEFGMAMSQGGDGTFYMVTLFKE